MQVFVSLHTLGFLCGGDVNPKDGKRKITDPNPHDKINYSKLFYLYTLAASPYGGA